MMQATQSPLALNELLDCAFRQDDSSRHGSFFPQPLITNDFTVVAGATLTINIILMVLRAYGFAIFAFIHP
ncbi:MAG: hypothetical protein ICV60_02195 [Pyrinomonadaceae bacterium]|nr:hypothetical protein [Pyrinomonadaceae bacterium]